MSLICVDGKGIVVEHGINSSIGSYVKEELSKLMA